MAFRRKRRFRRGISGRSSRFRRRRSFKKRRRTYNISRGGIRL